MAANNTNFIAKYSEYFIFHLFNSFHPLNLDLHIKVSDRAHLVFDFHQAADGLQVRLE